MTIYKTTFIAAIGPLALAACGGASDETASVEVAETPPAETVVAPLHPLLAEVAPGAYSL